MLGTDSFQGEVWLNRQIKESQATIIIGSVEPHYFAGFTGGRKSIFPGLTDLATIERNHNLANSLDAAPLKLEGNPVAEHLDELMGLISAENMLTIQLVQDTTHQILGCFCGNLHNAYREAVDLSRQVYAHKIKRKYDLVIAEMLPPLDNNLYQAQKALENCQLAVKDGGTIVIVSACDGGIGSDFFFELADKWDRERNESSDGHQYFGSHKLSRVNTLSKRIDIRLVSHLSDKDIRRVYYEPLDNLEKFIYSTMSECEKNNMAVVHDAGHTVLTT
jgi:nickel-dependent lactate racemase